MENGTRPMPFSHGCTRVLLRRLREIMAEPVSAQERLDRIVVLIAANMWRRLIGIRERATGP